MSLQPQMISGDTLTVLVQTVTKAIESTAGLSVKVDNVAAIQSRQESKIDGVLVGLAELKTQTQSINQAVDSIRKDVADHEGRLRVLEPTYVEVNKLKDTVSKQESEFKEYKKEQDKKDEDQDKAIIIVEKSLIRYGTLLAAAFFVMQLVISVFVAPWIQGLMGR